MKKQIRKKLSLSRETLYQLNLVDLTGVVGGTIDDTVIDKKHRKSKDCPSYRDC